MKSYEEAKALLSELQPQYSGRHNDFRRLRDFWHGRYWQDVDSTARGVASIFRDVSSARSDVGPDMKLVRNLVFDVSLKYQSFLSALPMIRTFADRPSRTARAQAQLKENVLYGLWGQANMNQALNKIAWFGPLMGDSFLGIWPDLENYCVHAVVRSPEHAYPVPCFDGSKTDVILFCWKTTPAAAKRSFPNWSGRIDDDVSEVEILEYSDSREFGRWIHGERTNGVQHDLGFNLFDQVPFIQVPGEPWNHGAVEQAVNLVEAGNALYSLMMQAMLENVFPRLILEDPMKFGETLDFGPGSVNAVNPGGKAYFLEGGGRALVEGVGLLQENERAIKQGTSMPDVNFGQFDASIITGKAVNALQGAGTGSVVEMVQGVGVGPGLTNWNSKALLICQRMFRDDRLDLTVKKPTGSYDINPTTFPLSFKGSEIVGSTRNEVVFSPYMDQHGKLVMGLQALGAGLVSKQWAREQIGIPDSSEMQEEIVSEVLEEAVIGFFVQQLQAEPSPDAADTAEAQVAAFIQGKPGQPGLRAPAAPAPPPGQPPGGPPGAPPQGGGGGGLPVAPLPGGGAVAAPAINLPPGSALGNPAGAPPPEAAPPAPAAPGAVTLQAAQQTLSGVDLQGRAWLVGEIVARGKADTVEVAITEPADKDPLAQAATFPITFHVVTGVPREQNVEIVRG